MLGEAIAAGGTTLRDYSRVTGEPGYFEQALKVYERQGLPCEVFGDLINRKVIGQRASYYCPHARLKVQSNLVDILLSARGTQMDLDIDFVRSQFPGF
ncbi:MAG: hypothetical protein Ct9H300mP14_12120 [Gammaproteobacteria bacterium]|nr:MAG: hypothetical protein Ct9H300mP14_12120 [Gammaproteobacteria bacterium]